MERPAVKNQRRFGPHVVRPIDDLPRAMMLRDQPHAILDRIDLDVEGSKDIGPQSSIHFEISGWSDKEFLILEEGYVFDLDGAKLDGGHSDDPVQRNSRQSEQCAAGGVARSIACSSRGADQAPKAASVDCHASRLIIDQNRDNWTIAGN